MPFTKTGAALVAGAGPCAPSSIESNSAPTTANLFIIVVLIGLLYVHRPVLAEPCSKDRLTDDDQRAVVELGEARGVSVPEYPILLDEVHFRLGFERFAFRCVLDPQPIVHGHVACKRHGLLEHVARD